MAGQGERADAEARRRELANFLRIRRSALTPADVGLAPGHRRRVPGLRREEVASLSSVSATWYTWLEQGRDVQPSAEVLDALARTLRLDEEERQYLRSLAGRPTMAPADEPPVVTPTLAALLDDVMPSPAFAMTEAFFLAAWNRAFAAIVGDPGDLDDRSRNLLQLSLSEQLVEHVVGWHDVIHAVVAQLRMLLVRRPADAQAWSAIAELVAAHPELAEAWDRAEVRSTPSASVRLTHGVFGEISLDPLELISAAEPRLFVVIARPTDGASRSRLQAWVDSAGPAVR